MNDKFYYTIGEVADLLGTSTSQLRYWGGEFDINVRKNRKGDRLFQKEDIEKLKVIQHMLKEEGYTIDGAKKKLKLIQKEKKAEKLLTSIKNDSTEVPVIVQNPIIETSSINDTNPSIESIISNQVNEVLINPAPAFVFKPEVEETKLDFSQIIEEKQELVPQIVEEVKLDPIAEFMKEVKVNEASSEKSSSNTDYLSFDISLSQEVLMALKKVKFNLKSLKIDIDQKL